MQAMRAHVRTSSPLWLAAVLALGAAAGLAAQAAPQTTGPKTIALLRADDEWTLRDAAPRSAFDTIAAAAPAERLERATGL